MVYVFDIDIENEWLNFDILEYYIAAIIQCMQA